MEFDIVFYIKITISIF